MIAAARVSTRMSATSVTHLAFLASICVYLAYGYPAGIPALLFQFALAAVSEGLHAWWPLAQRLVVVREGLFLAGIAAAWLIGTPIYPLVGFALCASLLMLVRHHALRFLPALCAADLVWCGVGGTPLAPAPLTPAQATVALVPLAVAALAAEGWLAAHSGARRSSRARTAGWAWLVPPVALCALLGLVLGLPAAHRGVGEIPVQPLRVPNPRVHPGSSGSGLGTMLRIGDQLRIDRDQRVAARLEWNGAPPRLGRMVYLRAITMPQVISEGPFLLWRAAEEGFTPFSAPFPRHAPTGWLLRRPGGGDAVLRPDCCTGVDLERMVRDNDGNWYQAGIGRQPYTYRVSLEQLTDPQGAEATPSEIAVARSFPRDLRDLPWRTIERSAWPALPPEDAAREIIEAVQDRCHYELENLPEPDPSPGGALRTFLFSDDIHDRRGHCQYFSTAAVILLRRAGHPARTVVGFASEEIDAKGVTFRGIHAHAWLELVNSRGRWQRFDATPAAGYLQRMANLDPATAEVPPPVAADRAAEEAGSQAPPSFEPLPGVHVPTRGAWIAGLAAGAVLLFAAWRWWRHRPGPETRRREAISRLDEGLFTCAREFGVAVRPNSTILVISEALALRSGIDLSAHLREHLAARYGIGPLPRPWPLAELRRALRANRRPDSGGGGGSSTPPGRRH